MIPSGGGSSPTTVVLTQW